MLNKKEEILTNSNDLKDKAEQCSIEIFQCFEKYDIPLDLARDMLIIMFMSMTEHIEQSKEENKDNN